MSSSSSIEFVLFTVLVTIVSSSHSSIFLLYNPLIDQVYILCDLTFMMDLSQDDSPSNVPVHPGDMEKRFVLVPDSASNHELSSSPIIDDETKNKNPWINDGTCRDNADRISTVLPYLAPHRETSTVTIKSEDVQEEDSQDEWSEENHNKDFFPINENLHDADGPHADYIRDGMTELRSWKRGKIYSPEQDEPQRTLLSSLPKFQECRDACNNIVHELREQLMTVSEHDHVLRVLADAIYPDTDKAERVGLQGAAGSGM